VNKKGAGRSASGLLLHPLRNVAAESSFHVFSISVTQVGRGFDMSVSRMRALNIAGLRLFGDVRSELNSFCCLVVGPDEKQIERSEYWFVKSG
jgi:hypothetical protein